MQNIEKLFEISNGNEDQIKKTQLIKENNVELFQSFDKLKLDIQKIEEQLKTKPITNEYSTITSEAGITATDNNVEKITKTVVKEVFTEIKYTRPQFMQLLQDKIVKEGDKVVLICHVIGEPKPNIEWFKDGISIQNNPDYRTSYLDNICTLSIDETFTADSGRFMCIASNLAGSDETAANLIVKEHSINENSIGNEQMIPPKIIKSLQNGVAREGSSFQFSCTVTGNPLPTVKWFKDDKCIDDSPDYVILYNNGEAILRFDEVFLEDNAVYTCNVSNPAGFEQCSAKLTVERKLIIKFE